MRLWRRLDLRLWRRFSLRNWSNRFATNFISSNRIPNLYYSILRDQPFNKYTIFRSWNLTVNLISCYFYNGFICFDTCSSIN